MAPDGRTPRSMAPPGKRAGSVPTDDVLMLAPASRDGAPALAAAQEGASVAILEQGPPGPLRAPCAALGASTPRSPSPTIGAPDAYDGTRIRLPRRPGRHRDHVFTGPGRGSDAPRRTSTSPSTATTRRLDLGPSSSASMKRRRLRRRHHRPGHPARPLRAADGRQERISVTRSRSPPRCSQDDPGRLSAGAVTREPAPGA